MLVSSIVRLTLGIKDHRIVSTRLANNELRIELDVKKKRKLPSPAVGGMASVFIRRTSSERGVGDMSPCGVLRSFSTTIPGESNVLLTESKWNVFPGAWAKSPSAFPLSPCFSFPAERDLHFAPTG